MSAESAFVGWLRRHGWIVATIVLLIFLDQWTKYLAVLKLSGGKDFIIIPNFFDFSLTFNKGAAFGIGRNWPPVVRKIVFLGISCGAAVLMLVMLIRLRNEGWLPTVGLTLILSGAIGNLIDRFRMGYVVDFIHVFYKSYHWPNFNIADSSICVGITLFAIYLIWFDKRAAVS